MQAIEAATRLIKVSYAQEPLQNLNSIFKYLDLNPAFQRKSVWTPADREKFITTVLEGMPCPTIFLFKRWDKRKKCHAHDVIDGKQRLETIFLFWRKLSPDKIRVSREKRKKIRAWVKYHNFSELSDLQQRDFWGFHIPIGYIELKDESDGAGQGMGDLIEAFVRINTQGRPLSFQERRNAQYIERPVLKLANKLTKKFNAIFSMSHEMKGRMKDAEITLEVLISIIKNEILNKKVAIDKALGETYDKKQLNKAKSHFSKICSIIRRLNLGKNIRFVRNTPDFYSLFIAVMELINSNCIFQRFPNAQKGLSNFSARVADTTVAYQNKQYGLLKKMADKPFYEYWLTTQKNSDSKENRRIRSNILKDILVRAIDKNKDKKRFFSIAQKGAGLGEVER